MKLINRITESQNDTVNKGDLVLGTKKLGQNHGMFHCGVCFVMFWLVCIFVLFGFFVVAGGGVGWLVCLGFLKCF